MSDFRSIPELSGLSLSSVKNFASSLLSLLSSFLRSSKASLPIPFATPDFNTRLERLTTPTTSVSLGIAFRLSGVEVQEVIISAQNDAIRNTRLFIIMRIRFRNLNLL